MTDQRPPQQGSAGPGQQGQGGGRGRKRRGRRRGGGGGGEQGNQQRPAPQNDAGGQSPQQADGQGQQQARVHGQGQQQGRSHGQGQQPRGQGQQGHQGRDKSGGRPERGDRHGRPDKDRGGRDKQARMPSSHQGRDKSGKGGQKKPTGKPEVGIAIDSRLKAEPADFKPEVFNHVPRRYGIVFYDTLAAAKADIPAILSKRDQFDQLNVVLRAEGGLDDPELNAIDKVKVFAGAAWTLIHERRMADGWYEEPR